MFYVILSILILTFGVFLVRRTLKWDLCPICFGVIGTWAGLLVLRFFGEFADPVILSLLLGGSVVGIALKGEEYLRQNRSSLIFKTLAVVIGFEVAYSVVYYDWKMVVFGCVIAVFCAVYFIKMPFVKEKDSDKVAKIVKELDNCC